MIKKCMITSNFYLNYLYIYNSVEVIFGVLIYELANKLILFVNFLTIYIIYFEQGLKISNFHYNFTHLNSYVIIKVSLY